MHAIVNMYVFVYSTEVNVGQGHLFKEIMLYIGNVQYIHVLGVSRDAKNKNSQFPLNKLFNIESYQRTQKVTFILTSEKKTYM